MVYLLKGPILCLHSLKISVLYALHINIRLCVLAHMVNSAFYLKPSILLQKSMLWLSQYQILEAISNTGSSEVGHGKFFRNNLRIIGAM